MEICTRPIRYSRTRHQTPLPGGSVLTLASRCRNDRIVDGGGSVLPGGESTGSTHLVPPLPTHVREVSPPTTSDSASGRFGATPWRVVDGDGDHHHGAERNIARDQELDDADKQTQPHRYAVISVASVCAETTVVVSIIHADNYQRRSRISTV